MARVTIAPGAAREIHELPASIQARLLRLVERLESWPTVSGARPLRGRLAGRYRMRTGDYRLQFHVRGDSIVIERAGHRDGFYED